MAVPNSEAIPGFVPAPGMGIGGLGGTYVAGTTQNVLTAGQIPLAAYYFASKRVYIANGDYHPLTWLLTAIGDQSGWGDRLYWYEKIPYPEVDELDGSVTSTSATINVLCGSKWTQDDTLHHYASGSQALVTAVAGNTLTISWVPGAAPAAPIASGSLVVRIGNAHPQYSQPVPRPLVREEQHNNVWQDLRHWTAASDQYIAIPQWHATPAGFNQQIEEKHYDHMVEFEKTLIFGRVNVIDNATAASPRGYTRGLRYFQVTNRLNLANTVMGRAAFENWVDPIIRQNTMPNQNWILLCSGRIHTAISRWGVPFTQTTEKDTRFGMSFQRFLTPDGNEILIKKHPLFNTHRSWNGLGILLNLNPKNIKLVWNVCCPGTRLMQSIVPFSGSGQEKGWRSVFSLYFVDERHNLGVIDNAA